MWQCSFLPFPSRASDVDDLILNTLGVVVGYGVFAAVKRIRKGGWPQDLVGRMPVSPVSWFRHRSLFFLFSRPCRAALSEKSLSGRTHFSYFSVQKHWKQNFSSMRNNIFPEILFHEGRECAQCKLLYRILGRPGRNPNKTSYLVSVLWTLFFLKCLSVPKAFLGTGSQPIIWVS